MERSETIERVAAGLRALQPHKPDVVGFLWLESLAANDDYWAETSIAGLPVFRSGYMMPSDYGGWDVACPFMPLFTSCSQPIWLQVARFVEAFCDWKP